MTVAIPDLTGRAIDAIRAGDTAELTTLGDRRRSPPASCASALTVARRLIAGRVSLGVELDLRNRIYDHLLSLELGFFDRQQTGQLMSRATVDLQAVRFFLGYGLVFIAAVGADDRARGGRDDRRCSPGSALIALLPVPFVVCIAFRYGRRSRPALQEVQQRIAELTADVEENVGGVRVVKAFAREERQLARFRTQRRPRLRPGDGLHAAAGLLQPVHRLPAADRPRRDPVLRRPRRSSTARSPSASSPPSTPTC